MKNWYKKSFGNDYLIVYKHRDTQGAYDEVRKMVQWLDLAQGSTILDLCCGTGRHSLALADFGYKVTGVDLSEVLLAEAVETDEGKRIEWVHGDMRKVPLQGPFDAVVNLFTSFGYFEKDEDNEQVLQEIRRLLRPKGKFIIDFLNPKFIADHLVPFSERVVDGVEIKETRKIEDGYVMKKIELSEQATSGENVENRVYYERVKLYTLAQFKEMMSRAGLTIEATYGSYGQGAYDEKMSPRLILIGAAN